MCSKLGEVRGNSINVDEKRSKDRNEGLEDGGGELGLRKKKKHMRQELNLPCRWG
jgi:hypothetical protein